MDLLFKLLTFILGAVGTGLGILNYVKSIQKERVKLRVCFRQGIPINMPNMPKRLVCVEVTNLSAFPVVINEVGMNMLGTDERAVFTMPFTSDNKPLPRKLESREQFTASADRAFLDPEVTYTHVYASTSCGTTVKSEIPTKSSDS